MKKALMFLLLVASSMAQTQNTPFVDLMLELQGATESYYNSMMETFKDARQMLSGYLIELNTVGVTELTEAIREVTEIGLEAMEWIEEATGDEECIRTAVDHWEQEKANVGISLASCADQFSLSITNATANLLDFITEQSQAAFEVQNLVLNAFAEVNPITDQGEITPTISARIDEIYYQFHYETVPSLFKLVEVVRGFQETLSPEFHDCLHADVVRMRDESLVMRNTLELC